MLYECTAIKAVNAKLIANGSIGKALGSVNGSAKFTGCITKLNGATSAPCQPKAGGVAGVVITKLGHGLAVLHELEDKTKDQLTQILPDEGETFATIETVQNARSGRKLT